MSLVTSPNSVFLTSQVPGGPSRSNRPLPPTSSPNDVLNIDAGSNHDPQNRDLCNISGNIAGNICRVSQVSACIFAGTYIMSTLCHFIGCSVTSSSPYDLNTMYDQLIGTAVFTSGATGPLTSALYEREGNFRETSNRVLTLMLLTQALQYSLGVLITEGDISQENQDEMKTIFYGQLMLCGGVISLGVSCIIIALTCECLITARDYAHNTCFKRGDNTEVSRRGHELPTS